jgi:NADPH:quinone reductase-like Zn-dependent oxidoreductase
VRATALNRADISMRTGRTPMGGLPRTLGLDIAGEVTHLMRVVHYGGRRGTVGRIFEWAEVAKAHEVMAGGDFSGELVLRVP